MKLFPAVTDIYKKEIKSYDGTVSLYLADKSQKLKVPERILSAEMEFMKHSLGEERLSYAF